MISAEKRHLFNGTVLLDHMVNTGLEFDSLLPGDEADLEPIITWLLTRGLVETSEKHFYRPSAEGRKAIEKFQERYHRILQYFDVFSSVDLGAGEFAYAHFSEFKTETKWNRFLNDDRWEDLRLAVATHLGADPVELVFTHFLKEGRFDFQKAGWQLTLREGLVWEEIETICETSLVPSDLAYADVSAHDVLSEVVEQGFLLVRTLSDHDPDVMAHLSRWSPSRQAPDFTPDRSSAPFWKTAWSLDLSPSF